MLTYRNRALKAAAGVAVAALALAACSTEADSQGNDDATATIVATTTQVGSIVEQLTACADGQTQVLMSAADDPHQFEASSAQIADMIAADLVVANGLGLESGMQRSLENAVTDGAEVLELAPQLDPLPLLNLTTPMITITLTTKTVIMIHISGWMSPEWQTVPR